MCKHPEDKKGMVLGKNQRVGGCGRNRPWRGKDELDLGGFRVPGYSEGTK